MALLLSDFLPNLVLSGDDKEAAAASALSASSFPFDFVVGICAAAVAASEEDVSVPEAVFAFSVAVTFDTRVKALKFQSSLSRIRCYLASLNWKEKAGEDPRYDFELLPKVPLLRLAFEPSSETGAE